MTRAASRLRDAGEPLIEARLDLLQTPADDALLAALARSSPRVIATCRPSGPGCPAAEADRLSLLHRAVARGAAGIDLELGATIESLPQSATLIASHHASEPLDAAATAAVARALAAMRPSIVKLAMPTLSAADGLAWADAAASALPSSVGLAAVPLSPAATWMRHLAGFPALAGGRPLSALTYVAEGAPLPGPALGQPSLHDALGDLRVSSVTGATRVHAVLGWPLEHTWSPALHARLFTARGEDARLVALPVRDGGEARRLLERLRVRGAALTMPHKALARDLASRWHGAAGRLGSANTLRWRDGAWEAADFDGPAAAGALASVLELRDAEIAVAGAGGAARAAALALVAAGARVHVLARDVAAAREVADLTGAAGSGPLDPDRLRRSDALVNATPAGSHGVPGLLATDDALPRRAVLDMVTTPHRTELVERARAAGLSVVDGLAMLARQAAAQQRFWADAEGATGTGAMLEAEQVERTLRAIVREAGGA